jgi:hypothetical protein
MEIHSRFGFFLLFLLLGLVFLFFSFYLIGWDGRDVLLILHKEGGEDILRVKYGFDISQNSTG